MLQHLRAFVLQLTGKPVGQGGEHFGQIDLHHDRVVADVDPAGDFLTQAAAFELEPVAAPILIERDRRTQALAPGIRRRGRRLPRR